MSTIQSTTSTPVSTTSPTSTSSSTSTSPAFRNTNLFSNPVFLQLLRLIIQLLQQIQSGQTPAPSPTPVPSPTPTPVPSPTPTPVPSPTPTPVPSPTPTPVPSPTPTPVPSPTPTPVPSPTPTPVPSPTPTPVPSPTPTPVPSPTPTPVPSPTPTPVPSPTPTPVPSPTPTPVPAPSPATATLTASERSILSSLFATNANGTVATGSTITALEGGTPDNRLGVGDTVVVRDASGNQLRSKVLTAQDIYDIRFRENMAATTNSIGSGWGFTNDIVQIAGGRLSRPESRSYTDPINGARGTEQVLERNNFWEIVQRGGNRYMVMRTADNSGNAIKPSDALNDLFNNRSAYRFDCATPMTILNLKATLDTIGAAAFDRSTQGKLAIASWYDPFDNSNFDGGYISRVRTAPAGTIVVNGRANLEGETALFDPNQGDRLTVGNTYYFDKPGDNTSATQGWNAVYLGQAADGNHRFWSASIGEVAVKFNADGSWTPTGGTFGGYYLGAAIANPNLPRLQNWGGTAIS
ncbi:MAG: hypothetical protein WAQ53_09825 [Thiofilum sp.]|uniref:hypothetical protein n=1 Tax=Thiofilum sp. TaxID=2212733 RepID=UPI003BB05D09